MHDVAGAIQAQPGMKQQTFVAQPLFCLNDQGGERMDVTEDVSSTLRAGMGGHPPLVSQPNCMNSWDTQQSRVFTPEGVAPTLAGADGGGGRNPAGLLFAAGVVSKGDGDCFLTPETHTSLTGGGGQAGQGYPCVLTAGFCGNASAEARGIGYQAEYSPTIKTGTAPSVLCLNDQGGSQMHSTEDITGTLRAQEHGHQPVLFENHGIDSRYTGPHAVAPTMSARMGTGGNNVPLVGIPVAFSLDSKESNSMKSANPHSGCRETDVARTIDTTNPDPSKNQGGIAILQETICIAGNTIDREPENGGNGLGCKPDISYTITTSDRHAVCEPYQEVVGALCRGDEKGIGSQYVSQNKCIVEKRNLIRRLTPLECERLQGFPDGWTLIPGASDSARYKALGNSVAIPCVSFVLRGIAYFLRKIDEEQEESPPCTSTPTT